MIYWQCPHQLGPRLGDPGEAPRSQEKSIIHPTLKLGQMAFPSEALDKLGSCVYANVDARRRGSVQHFGKGSRP